VGDRIRFAMKLLPFLLFGSLTFAQTVRPPDIPFQKLELDLGASETAAVADINRDGKLDIISGENWYAGPKWTKTKFRSLHWENNYVDALTDLTMDVDGDGWVDVLTCSWFSKEIVWWKNPGKSGEWKKLPIIDGYNTEFMFLVDLNNDGKAREVLPQFGGAAPTLWLEFKDGKWHQHLISELNFGHGIGAGDVNGDKRTDVLTSRGWFEAPSDLQNGTWTRHADWELKEQLSFIHVHDVDGDQQPEVIAGNAHDYGLFVLKKANDGKWNKSMIDVFWSQVHAVTLVDLNQDGKLDILTGKRFLAHDTDPGSRDVNGIYWYERVATKRGNPWVRHIIDYGSRTGGGMQMPAVDLDGDGDVDFVAPGKGGLFVFLNKTK
jgi:hypothetical protein